MATYKLEIIKQFGKIQHRLFPSSGSAPDFTTPVGDVHGLLDVVTKSLDDVGVTKADTVVFRQIGYDNRDDLREAVRTATY